MLFDFERFTTNIKLAYRHCDNNLYSLEDVQSVFKYYFETYEFVFEKVHPVVTVKQIRDIIEKMPYVLNGEETMIDISVDDYEMMIDQHFVTKYKKCDYNIIHFFSGRVRELRYFESCYWIWLLKNEPSKEDNEENLYGKNRAF